MGMKKNNITKLIVLLLSMLMPVAFSDWIYLNETSTIETKNDDECIVSIYTRLQSNKITESSPVTSEPVEDEATGRFVDPTLTEKGGTKWSNTYHKDDPVGSLNVIETKNSLSEDHLSETITITYRQKKVVEEPKDEIISWLPLTYQFTYTVAWFSWTKTVVKTKEKPVDNHSSTTLKVARNSFIKPFELPVAGFEKYTYFSDSSYSTLFDFSKPIKANTSIYLKYCEGRSSLSEFLNGKTSGTYAIYDSGKGGSGSGYDIFSDFVYETAGGFDYINDATVASGTTINFVYSDNKVCPSPNTGAIEDGDGSSHRDSQANVALDYYNNQYIGTNHCSLMVRLNGDLTVKGTLNIGAKVGGVSSNVTFSQIIGEYTQLDLNGHDLIIDGGTVNCYGSIVDRIGGGKMLIKNKGKIMGLLTVTDGRGGNQMTYGYGKGQSPFDEYRFAYIEAPIVAMHGTTVTGYLKLDLGGLGISNIYANIIGESGSSVFSWGNKKNADDRIEIIPYINTNLYPSQVSGQSGNTVYLKMYYYRYKYIFCCDVILNSQIPLKATIHKIVKKDVEIDWARIGVPIPPFFDLLLSSGYQMTLKAKALLLPGCSFFTEKNSVLFFDPGEVIKYDDVKINVPAVVEAYIKGETTRNRGGLMAYDRSFYTYNGASHKNQDTGVYAQKTYWKYTRPSNHMIMGDVFIRDMPDSYKYLISGPISFSKKSIGVVENSPYVQTYDIKGEQNGSLWFNGENRTYESSYNLITSFNTLPLISNSKAYIKDSNLNLKGTFDSVTRLFNASNGKKYFLWTKNDFLKDGSAPGNQNSLTDYDVKPTIVEGELNNQIVKAANTYYLNYKGVFVPILDSLNPGTTYSNVTASIRKFCSNNSTKLYVDSSKYDKVKLSFNATNKMWEFNGFVTQTTS